MSWKENISSCAFSDLEKVFIHLRNNFDFLWERLEIIEQEKERKALAQIENKIYAGVRKYFK